jgi:uncharacterized paraquat-inducible protein A
MTVSYFVLDERNMLVPCKNLVRWGIFMGSGKNIVAVTHIDENVKVSTIFLGVSFIKCSQTFETMIFGGERDDETYRCDTWEQAVAQHNGIVATFTAENRWKCESCGAINISNENLECRKCGAHPDK